MAAKFRVRISTGAKDDIAQVKRELTRRADPSVAKTIYMSIRAKAKSLSTYALRGPIVPELQAIGIQRYRQLLIFPYRMIYEVVGDEVRILLVADGRRDFEILLEQHLLKCP